MSTKTAIGLEIWSRLRPLMTHLEFHHTCDNLALRTFTLDVDVAEPIELDCASIPDDVGMKFSVSKDGNCFVRWNNHQNLIEFGLSPNIKLINVRLNADLHNELTDTGHRGKWLARDRGLLLTEPQEAVVSGEIYSEEALISFWADNSRLETSLLYAG